MELNLESSTRFISAELQLKFLGSAFRNELFSISSTASAAGSIYAFLEKVLHIYIQQEQELQTIVY